MIPLFWTMEAISENVIQAQAGLILSEQSFGSLGVHIVI